MFLFKYVYSTVHHFMGFDSFVVVCHIHVNKYADQGAELLHGSENALGSFTLEPRNKPADQQSTG